MVMNTKQKGNMGEDFVSDILKKDGYRILCRNYKGAHGEIDIICEKGSYIVFAEVKLREILSEKPSLAVDEKKIGRIRVTINEFLREFMDNNYITSLTPRIDVFEVICKNGVIAKYVHFEDVDR